VPGETAAPGGWLAARRADQSFGSVLLPQRHAIAVGREDRLADQASRVAERLGRRHEPLFEIAESLQPREEEAR